MQKVWLNNIIAETDQQKREEADRADKLKEDIMKDHLDDMNDPIVQNFPEESAAPEKEQPPAEEKEPEQENSTVDVDDIDLDERIE